MILIVTHKEDFTADFLINILNQKAIAYYRFNCEDLPFVEHSFSSNLQFSATINHISSFSAVWFRRTKLPSLQADGLSEAERNNLLSEYDALLFNLLQTISVKKWLSQPNAIYNAENKLYQLRLAHEIGFTIPETLVTNNKERLLTFSDLCKGDVIIKPLKSGRIKDLNHQRLIYTNKLQAAHLANIDQYDLTPSIFQKRIEKEYELRITVIGNEVFAAKVDSQSDPETIIDWRKKKLKFAAYKLPPEIADQCRCLTSKLDLSFGAIDMIKSTDGSYYFLEINPNGQWAWVEIDTGMDISGSIINFLTDV
jgi:glutathione synthase/RimK-type ligase-like ATP-grasp enzyme